MKKEVRIGAKIKELREARNLTQGELAEQVGTSQAFISQLEGDAKGVSFPTAVRLSEVLEVNIQDFM